ncbi:MAG TPA: DUF4476 domain-containing protein [Adhaeribacter sp.]|nr:DUF4476 domain-containing protein [Adhaeribacter sp.]
MKRYAAALFLMALLLGSLAAHAASATFTTRRGEIFQLFLNGQLVNGRGSNQVKVDRLPAGPHILEFRVPARRGILTYTTKIFLDRGFETNFVLITPGYNPHFMLKKVNMVPLRPPVCHTCPPPPGHQGYFNGQPGYDDYDSYGYQPEPHQDNYPNAPGYGNHQQNPPQELMSNYDVNLLLESMSIRNFDSAKVDIARQALSNRFILAEDAKRLMQQFSFEGNRLDFAKFVYPQVYDQQNFYRVYDAFEFNSSITEMDRWLKR